MPLYTFICQKCKEKFNLLVGVNQEQSKLACIKCDSGDIKRSFGNFGISASSSGGHSGCSSCSGGSCSSCSH